MGSIRKHDQMGTLFFDFRFQGVRCREYTALSDTASNRKKMQKILETIEQQISIGSFNYRDFFPASKNVAKFEQLRSAASVDVMPAAIPTVPVSNTPLFKEFSETWFSEKSIEWRNSHKKNVRDVIDKRLIPSFGDKAVGNITKADILSFRADLAKVQARGKSTQLSNPRINKILVVQTFLWVSSTLSRMVFKEGMRWKAWNCIGTCLE